MRRVFLSCLAVARRAPPLGWLLAALCLVVQPGCSALSTLRTKGALRQLNGTSHPPDPSLRTPLRVRIARLTKSHLADAYVDRQRAAAWMDALGAEPTPLTKLVACLGTAIGDETPACHSGLTIDLEGVLPAPPSTMDVLKARTSPEAAAELDAERFVANTRALGSTLAALERMIGRGALPASELRQGIADGARRAATYVAARDWHRDVERPSTAIVLSGGAANGAFSAGLVWRLLEVLQSCRSAAAAGCGSAHVDLVVGTSTGALIGLVVDMAHTPGYEARARDLLVDAYTCSVNARLYCVNDTWTLSLAAGDLKGIARFDGVRKMIKASVPEAVTANPTERVAVSVDFESGSVYGQSDQDPEDAGDWDQQIDSLLASIVEPVMAEPIPAISRDGQPLPGTFLDGGVRSGLPLLEAVHRGAERVLVVNTGGVDPTPARPPKNAFQILTRTIDLAVGQLRPGELQQGELAALERRWLEYAVCNERLAPFTATTGSDVARFCERRAGTHLSAAGLRVATPVLLGPAYFREVASSWRTVWVFRPEEDVPTAAGYAFDPIVMRGLFELGARTFQHRCPEILDLFGIDGNVAHASCQLSDDEVTQRARATYKPIAACGAVSELSSCE